MSCINRMVPSDMGFFRLMIYYNNCGTFPLVVSEMEA